ncbi:MAG: class I SAM-dependent methyltransferase family protein [Promethearchaeota archaeon]|nr:MAG: class I SAM-dependent methyltransferase family protein [Candidatus Lokiarchaeota archaeon]
MKFKNKLRNSLKNILKEDELLFLPRGFQTLGDVIIIKLNQKLFEKERLIAEAYLNLLPKIRSVYVNRGKIIGTFREPEKIELIGGEDNPIIEHKEHDVIYKFDITKIMFSKGNINERKYLASLVTTEEIIVDMFAGIGYFSLPIAKHSPVERIYSIELNPESYKFLVENIKINHLEDKIIPINGNCNIEVVKLSKSGIRANRIIMGVFPAPKEYIKEALTLVGDNGTIIHYEGVVENEKYLMLFEEFKKIAKKESYKCELKTYRFVKSYGPNLYHIVLDIFVLKN